MNNSNLNLYNSTSSLSTRLSDVFNVFVLTPICFIGIFFNLSSVIILIQIIRNKKDKRNVFTYMLLNQLVDLLFCIINIFVIVIRCGQYCSYAYTYYAKLYEQYVFLFIGNCVSLFGTLLEISINYDRIKSFNSNKKPNLVSFKTKCFILIIFVLLINTPIYLVARNVTLIGVLTNDKDSYLYLVLSNQIGQNFYGKLFIFILTLLRGLVLLNVLFCLNLYIVLKFKNHMRKKLAISGLNNRSESRVTKFVLVTSLFYLIGNVPSSVSPILYIFEVDRLLYENYLIFGNLVLFISHGSFFFIYYFSNNIFKKAVLKIIHLNKL